MNDPTDRDTLPMIEVAKKFIPENEYDIIFCEGCGCKYLSPGCLTHEKSVQKKV